MMMQDKHKIPITILICDDDEDDRLLTQQALEDAHIANDLRFVERQAGAQHANGFQTAQLFGMPWMAN